MKHVIIEETQPLVSIIVPAYNAEKYIGATLNSLVTQTFPYFEIIVVNDGSTDKTEDVVKQFYFDRRLKMVRKDNGGTGSALNMGHGLARGKFATWCSADNIYFPTFIQELAQALMHCEANNVPVEFMYSDFTYMDANGNRLQDVVHKKPQPKEDLANGYDLGMSFMYTMALWRRTGLYWNRICEDYDWAVRAAQHTNFGLLPVILAAFRVHPNQISGHKQQEENAAAEACRQKAKQLLLTGAYGPKPAFKPQLVENA